MSVTAFPVIKVDSTDGAASDSLSGAGPATALTGTAAASTGTTVVLDALTDLTGVATDGSHVLYFADATAGNRNFAAINGKSGSGGATPTVTVEQSLATATKAWAIGGVRATAFGSISRKLFNNNGSAGDRKPGWAVEMQSAHAETITAKMSFIGSGDTTGGRMILRGVSGAAVRPVITANQADYVGEAAGAFELFEGFQVKNNNAGCTYGFVCSAGNITFRDFVLGGGTQPIINAGFYFSGVATSIEDCEISHCGTGVIYVGDSPASRIIGTRVHDTSTYGLYVQGAPNGNVRVEWCVFHDNATHIRLESSSSIYRTSSFVKCTMDGGTGDGIVVTGTGDGLNGLVIANCSITNCSGTAVNFSDTPSLATLLAYNVKLLNNNWYADGSGFCNLASLDGVEFGTFSVDPDFVGGGDYTPQEAAMQAAYPVSIP